MEDAVDLDGRHRGPFQRRQQNAAKRVADRRPEAALERLRRRLGVLIRPRLLVEDQTLW